MIYLCEKGGGGRTLNCRIESVWAALLSQIKHRLLAHLRGHAKLTPALICGPIMDFTKWSRLLFQSLSQNR